MSRAQYQGSQGDKWTSSDLTGARVHSQPKGIREHTTSLRSITHQSTGVRDHTITLSEDTNVFSGRVHSLLCVGPSHSALLLIILENPPWTQLTQRDIIQMAETICQSSQTFAGRISLFCLNWKALTPQTWVIQTVTEATTSPHVCPQPILPSPQPSPVLRGHYNIGKGYTAFPAETGHLSKDLSST